MVHYLTGRAHRVRILTLGLGPGPKNVGSDEFYSQVMNHQNLKIMDVGKNSQRHIHSPF
jgi:hypothetical protein